MSGFLSGSTALSLYKIDDAAAVTTDKIKQYAFRSIDNIDSEAKAWGWTSIEDMLDTAWERSVPEKGEFLCFALRIDTRKVPGPVLQKHLALAIREEQECRRAEGDTDPISKVRKKELKEQVSARLLAKIEPVPATVDVAFDTRSGCFYLGTTSASLCELFRAYAEQSFGPELQSLWPEVDDVPVLLKSLYQQSRDVPYDGHTYALAEAGQLTLLRAGAEDAAEVTVKNEADSARTGLEAGLVVTKLKLRMERIGDESLVWEFTLNAEARFLGLKTPKVEKSDEDDPDAVLLEKLYLIQQAVGVVRTLLKAH